MRSFSDKAFGGFFDKVLSEEGPFSCIVRVSDNLTEDQIDYLNKSGVTYDKSGVCLACCTKSQLLDIANMPYVRSVNAPERYKLI